MDFEEFVNTDSDLAYSIKRYDRKITDPKVSRKRKLKLLIKKDEAVKKRRQINEDMVWLLCNGETQ